MKRFDNKDRGAAVVAEVAHAHAPHKTVSSAMRAATGATSPGRPLPAGGTSPTGRHASRCRLWRPPAPPVRAGGIVLDPDVARVFRDSEAVNEALRMVIRLARTVGGSRPPFARNGAAAGPRSSTDPLGSERISRTFWPRPRPRERPLSPRPTSPDPRFDEAE